MRPIVGAPGVSPLGAWDRARVFEQGRRMAPIPMPFQTTMKVEGAPGLASVTRDRTAPFADNFPSQAQHEI
jgi:hypothetical protein